MAPLLNITIKQSADGTYSATIAEFPQIAVSGAGTLEMLKAGLEQAISMVPNDDGSERDPVQLPPLVPGQTTGTVD